MTQATTRVPHFRMSHVGICTSDIAKMERFYTETLGFTVTDRGFDAGTNFVFMSRDPMEHHQFVLIEGRPSNLPGNTINPILSPCINQLSFALPDLRSFKALAAHFQAVCPDRIRMALNHGTSISIYVADPEDNTLEFYFDSEWYCSQPNGVPVDLTQSDEALLEQLESVARASRNFEPAASWRARMAKQMEARLP